MSRRALFLAALALCLTSTYAKPQQRDTNSGYDDNLARRFFNVAAASYPNNTEGGAANRSMCLDKAFPYMNWRVVQYEDFECDSNGGYCRAFLAVSDGASASTTAAPVTSAPDVTSTTDQPTTTPFPLMNMGPTVFISFRGTEGGDQFEKEINDGARDPREYYDSPPGSNGPIQAGGINAYFGNAGNQTWLRFQQKVNYYAARNYSFKCTGHSLGGALSSYFCFRLVFSNTVPKEKVQVISFGEPRLGDEKFAQSFNQYLPNSYRVVHYRDPIPHLPPASFKGSDGLHMRHHRQEIWYDQNDMAPGAAFRQCDFSDTDLEASSCSNHLFDNVLENIWHFFKDGGKMHVHYFNHVIPTYGLYGCVDSASGLSTFVAICLSLLTVLRIA